MMTKLEEKKQKIMVNMISILYLGFQILESKNIT